MGFVLLMAGTLEWLVRECLTTSSRPASFLPFRFFGDGGCGTATRAGSASRGYVSVRVFGWLTLHPASELVEDPA